MQTLFNRSPWERPTVLRLDGARLGQVAPGCEPTPEGGYRCPDGTYLPPGCGQGSASAVQAAPPGSASFPIVPVALAVAAAGAVGYLALSGRRSLGLEVPEALAPAFERLDQLATSIKAERAADAWNFSQYLEKNKAALDLLEKERIAEQDLAKQSKVWETSHRNADELQAAQALLDAIQSQRNNLKAEAGDFRLRIDQNAQNVVNLRGQALALIDSLPDEYKEDARKKIEPCFKNPVMQGRLLGQVRLGQMYSWNSGGDQSGHGFYNWNTAASPNNPEARVLQNAQASMTARPPLTPEQRLLQQNGMNDPGFCYTCESGGDRQSGVDAATASILRQQGYLCRPDQCGPRDEYGAGAYNGYNPFGNPMATAVPRGGDRYATMGRRFPVVNA